MKRQKTSLLVTGSLVSALLSFLPLACCLMPLAFAFLGAGTLAFATKLLPYRPYFILFAFLCLGLGFYFSYRRDAEMCADNEVCAKPASKKITRIVLWMTALLTLALVLVPDIIPYLST